MKDLFCFGAPSHLAKRVIKKSSKFLLASCLFISLCFINSSCEQTVPLQQVSIRGATTANQDSKEEIEKASLELVREIVKRNNLNEEYITAVFVSMTSDLHSYNVSRAIRLGMNWDKISFFTLQEADIDNMLPRCIRVLVQYNSSDIEQDFHNVYLRDAANLR